MNIQEKTVSTGPAGDSAPAVHPHFTSRMHPAWGCSTMNMTHTTTFDTGIPEKKIAGENRSRSGSVPTCRLTFEIVRPGDRDQADDEDARTGRTAAGTSAGACRQSEAAYAVCTAEGAPVLFLWGEHAEWFLS